MRADNDGEGAWLALMALALRDHDAKRTPRARTLIIWAVGRRCSRRRVSRRISCLRRRGLTVATDAFTARRRFHQCVILSRSSSCRSGHADRLRLRTVTSSGSCACARGVLDPASPDNSGVRSMPCAFCAQACTASSCSLGRPLHHGGEASTPTWAISARAPSASPGTRAVFPALLLLLRRAHAARAPQAREPFYAMVPGSASTDGRARTLATVVASRPPSGAFCSRVRRCSSVTCRVTSIPRRKTGGQI